MEEFYHMKTVKEFAVECHVSVKTIYRALDSLSKMSDDDKECPSQPLTTKVKGVTYILDEGESTIIQFIDPLKKLSLSKPDQDQDRESKLPKSDQDRDSQVPKPDQDRDSQLPKLDQDRESQVSKSDRDRDSQLPKFDQDRESQVSKSDRDSDSQMSKSGQDRDSRMSKSDKDDKNGETEELIFLRKQIILLNEQLSSSQKQLSDTLGELSEERRHSREIAGRLATITETQQKLLGMEQVRGTSPSPALIGENDAIMPTVQAEKKRGFFSGLFKR
jgi:hypothetical protein